MWFSPVNLPPRFKMTSFNVSDITALLGEVAKHNANVLADTLQPHADLLFNIIKEEVEAKHDDIMKDFKKQIRETRGEIKKVSVPVWRYKTRIYKKPRDVYEAELHEMLLDARIEKRQQEVECDRICRLNGWHWTIGVGYANAPPVWGEDVGAFVPEAWTLKPVPVHLVMWKTDLLVRLSTLFAANVWVERAYGRLIYETPDYEIREMVVNATLYPRGLLADNKRRLDAVRVKYPWNYVQAYAPHPDDEEVVLLGPDNEVPRTPPVSPALAPAQPPPIGRPVCPREDYLCMCYDGSWD